ncbi:MAG: hypothetical protein ACERKZ_14250 [Lachnotalea sp.]
MKINNKNKLVIMSCILCTTLFTSCSKTNNTNDLSTIKMNTESEENSIQENETDENVDNENMDSTESRNDEMISQDQAISTAQLDISEETKAMITNYDTPEVEEITFSEEPNISKVEGAGEMVGNDFYTVTFHTTEEEIVGPIVYYIGKTNGKIYGGDWQE